MTSTIAYFKNGIGNWVLLTPALQALASQEDDGKIDVVLDDDWSDSRTPAVVDLVRSSPFVDRVIMYPRNALNPRRYKRWFYSRHSEGSAALQLFESQNPTVGHKVDWRRGLMHEMDYYMNIVRECFGYRGETPRQLVHRGDVPKGVEEAFGSRDTWVALCNGGFGKMRAPKCWPYFKQLAVLLKQRYGMSIVGLGGKDELRGVKMDLDLTGWLSMSETIAVMSQEVDYLITTDTGLMHVGDALETSMVVLFGGSILTKNGPVNQQNTIVRASVPCVPCQYVGDFEKCQKPVCMTHLSVGQVMMALRGRL